MIRYKILSKEDLKDTKLPDDFDPKLFNKVLTELHSACIRNLGKVRVTCNKKNYIIHKEWTKPHITIKIKNYV